MVHWNYSTMKYSFSAVVEFEYAQYEPMYIRMVQSVSSVGRAQARPNDIPKEWKRGESTEQKAAVN